MPIIDGKVVRSRWTGLKLNELSTVDRPAQPGALAAILKRYEGDDPPAPSNSMVASAIAKYVGREDGAHSFTEVLRENKFSEAIWPLTDAFTQSIRSIVGDTTVTVADREAKIATSVTEFLAAVRSIDPQAVLEVEKQLLELISKRNSPMPKTIEELTAKVAELTGQMTAATGEITSLKAKVETGETALKAEQDAHGETKKALTEATDAVIKVGETEIRKSVVGEPQFAAMKAMQDDRDTALIEKRVSEEYHHVAGTAAEKVLVLKARAVMSEDAQKALDAILLSAEKLARAGFDSLGSQGGMTPTSKAAGVSFTEKVQEIQKRDNIPEFEAMRKARSEHPDLFEAMQGGEPAPAAAN